MDVILVIAKRQAIYAGSGIDCMPDSTPDFCCKWRRSSSASLSGTINFSMYPY